MGCGVLGIYPSCLLAGLTWEATGGELFKEKGNEAASLVVLIAAMGASIITGALIGTKMDRNNALKAIKEARKPEIVERF
ncbi:unnamed protein product [marine sediment metagenome]|uniref:Uncharacterized protein n=1 Tax=marine sediment metagenome TaxID=412755 RepID=X1QL92_9ZZZZ